MIIEAEDEPLSPIIDGERFLGIVKLVARAGPQIRIAQPAVAGRAQRGVGGAALPQSFAGRVML